MCGQNIHHLNIWKYFVDYKFVNQNTHTLNILETVLFKCPNIDQRVISLFTSKHSFISIFKKTLTIDDINRFIQEDNLKCLIFEATNECCYGFNLSNGVEKAAAIQVVSDKQDFPVGGWSIGKVIPSWVKSFEEWNIYNRGFNQVNNVGAKSFVDDDILGIDSKLKSQNCIDDLQKDVEAGEKDIYDNVVTTEEHENINGKVIHNPYLKVMPEHILSNVKTKFVGNADVFDVCGNELKKEISTNIIKANKSESIEVDVCRPFRNSKTGQGSYIVICGVLKKGWTLKAPFIRGYLGTLVERMNSRKNTRGH
jgi:hypothetical protein